MAGGTSGFRRELNIWEAVGISVALMAPSMAANINPQGVIGSVGRAVPLTFALATVGVLLVSYTFVRLTQKFHHSGSVYGFVGATLGARTGVVAGWGLLGTYTFYAVVTSTAAGRFLTSFLDGLGIWNNPPQWEPFLFALLALLGVYALTVSPVRRGTRFLLTVEGLTVLLILVVSVIILAKLAAGSAPNGNEITFTPFAVQPGTETSALFLGVVFGFLSFAGFEAAATLGEEARQPRRDIPRAILGTAIFGGLYFIFVTWVEVMGFGTDKAGQDAFAASGSLLGDLGGAVRRQLGRRPDQPRRRGERVRLRAGLRGRRVPAAVRARPGRRRADGARPGPRSRAAPRPRPPGWSSAARPRWSSSSASPTGTTSRRRSACSPTPA